MREWLIFGRADRQERGTSRRHQQVEQNAAQCLKLRSLAGKWARGLPKQRVVQFAMIGR